MFCKNCGNEIPEGSSFCPRCGQQLSSFESQEEPLVKNDHLEQMQKIISKKTEYYLNQFDKANRGEKNNINWASFFLSFMHAGYRNVWKEWIFAMKLPLIAEFVLLLAAIIALFANPTLSAILYGAEGIISIWLLIMQFLFAKKFNLIYQKHVLDKIVKNDDRPDPSAGRAILSSIIMAVISSIISALLSAVAVASFTYALQKEWSEEADFSDYDNSAYTTEPEDTSEYDTDLFEDNTEEEIPTTISDFNWEDNFVRTVGPAASFSTWQDDNGNLMFAVGIGTSGYLAYVDLRDCEATSLGDETYLYTYDPDDTNYQICMQADENDEIIVTENMESPFGFNLSGIYTREENTVYPDCEFVFPDSDTVLLSIDDCYGLTAGEARIARNEIYARYGREFNDEQLQAYFETCSWYYGTIAPDDFSEDILSDTEKNNLNTLSEYEKSISN